MRPRNKPEFPMARKRPEGVFVVGQAVCPCTVCLLPSQGTSFKFADLAPHWQFLQFVCTVLILVATKMSWLFRLYIVRLVIFNWELRLIWNSGNWTNEQPSVGLIWSHFFAPLEDWKEEAVVLQYSSRSRADLSVPNFLFWDCVPGRMNFSLREITNEQSATRRKSRRRG